MIVASVFATWCVQTLDRLTNSGCSAAFMSPGMFIRSINQPTVDAVIVTQVQSTVLCRNATMEA